MATKAAEISQERQATNGGRRILEPPAFITPDGCRYEVADGENLGRATALASEEALKRMWGNDREDKMAQWFGE